MTNRIEMNDRSVLKRLAIAFFSAALVWTGSAAEHVEVTPEYVMAIDKSPQPEWIIARPGDMRLADGLEFSFRVDDPEAFDMFRVYFRTGKGQYMGVFEPGEPGKWNRVFVSKNECYDSLWDVAGWSDVKCVTIGGQFGDGKKPKFRIADVRVIRSAPEILVVRGDSSMKKFRWNRHDRSACTMTKFLRDMGAPAVQVSDLELDKGIPDSVKLIVFPSNPGLHASAKAVLEKFAARGGRMFACFYPDSRIRRLMGFGLKTYYDRRKDTGAAPFDGLLPAEGAPEGMPAFLRYRFNTIHEPVAGTGVQPLAYFADAGRRKIDIVALAKVPGGFFFSTGWNCWGRDARSLMRSVLLSVEPAWRAALDRGMASADRADAADAAWLASLKPKPGEIRKMSCHDEKGYGGLGWGKSVAISKAGGYNTMFPNVAWGNRLFKEEAVDCLEACRTQNMACVLWKVCWRRHRDTKQDFPGRVMRTVDGQENPVWMCPSDPANRASEMDQFLQLARLRPEGVALDFIRYPGGKSCACDGCQKLFSEKIGVKIGDFKKEVWEVPEMRARWFDCRREILTSFVRDVSKRIRSECPGVKIYAAVFRYPESARGWFGQDWIEWCREGILDYASPMNYYQGNVAGLRQLMTRQKKMTEGMKGRLLPTLGPFEWPRTGGDAVRFAQEIELVRELGFEGFGVFQLSDRTVATMPSLRAGLLSD